MIEYLVFDPLGGSKTAGSPEIRRSRGFVIRRNTGSSASQFRKHLHSIMFRCYTVIAVQNICCVGCHLTHIGVWELQLLYTTVFSFSNQNHRADMDVFKSIMSARLFVMAQYYIVSSPTATSC